MLNPGLKIHEYRRRKGWTQAELAARAGVAQANLSNIEKGKRDFTVLTLLRFAAALEVRPSELLDEPAAPKPFKLTRAQVETLAACVAAPEKRASSEIRELAALFRATLPQKGARPAAGRAQEAWNRLREKFSSREIQGIMQRIEDAGQRGHA